MKSTVNAQFVARLHDKSLLHGGMVMQAIEQFAKKAASMTEEDRSKWGMCLIEFDAWKEVAEDIGREIEAHRVTIKHS